MILEALMNIIYTVLNTLLVFEIPKMPTEVTGYIDQFFDYLVTGAGILANYTPLGYLLVLFGIILAVDVGVMVYKFVMWVIRKIPFLGMS